MRYRSVLLVLAVGLGVSCRSDASDIVECGGRKVDVVELDELSARARAVVLRNRDSNTGSAIYYHVLLSADSEYRDPPLEDGIEGLGFSAVGPNEWIYRVPTAARPDEGCAYILATNTGTIIELSKISL